MNASNISAAVIIQVTNCAIKNEIRYLCELDGKTVLEFLVARIQAEFDGDIIIASTTFEEDNIFEEISKKHGIKIYRGSYIDVPRRLLGAMNLTDSQDFIRVFGNHPLVDIDRMKAMLKNHIAGCYDYSFNGHLYGDVWGTESEVISVKCLKKILNMNINETQMHEFAFIIRQNKDKFKVLKQPNVMGNKRPSYKLVFETPDDYKLIGDVIKNVSTLSSHNIIEYLDKHPILAKSNHASPSKEVGLDKLYLHYDKLKNIYINKGYVDFIYPVSVELSFTNRCNLACVYCSDQGLRVRQGVTDDFQIEVLFRLFDDLRKGGTKGVVIEGGGEPTLHPDFEEIVNYASNTGLALGLITNGTKELGKDILKKFEWIRISLDASNPEEYFNIKKVNCFERVMANISNYGKYCETVGVGFVVTNANISELEALVLRLREIEVAYIQLRPVVDNQGLYPYGEDLSYLLYYQTSKFAVIIDGMTENSEVGNFNIPCRCHSLTTVITADGSVFLCGRLNIYDWIKPIGNLYDSSFRNIWHGSERIAQSELVYDSNFCKEYCPPCRISKFNKLIDNLSLIKSKNFI